MADDRLRFILDFVAQTAGLKNAQELAEQLGDELGDAEDAGKQMAAALKAAADKATQELEETVALADKLGEALGPELTARVDVDEIAGKMRQVGMTIEDVDANVDSFKASLSQMADTADTAKARLGDMDTGVRKVGDSTDRTRGVMANFTGNALQELPLVGGAFAPLNQAIGQFAEYATEGDIKLGNFIKTAGGMAAVAIFIQQVSSAFSDYKAAIDGVREAHEDLANQRYDEAARKIAEGYATWYKNAELAGVSTEDLTDAIMGSDEALQRVNDQLDEAKTHLLDHGDTALETGNAIAVLEASLDAARRRWIETGDAAANSGDLIAAIRAQIGPTNEELANTTAISDALTHSIEAQTTAWEKLWGALEKMPTAKVNLGALAGLTRVDQGGGNGVDGSIAARVNVQSTTNLVMNGTTVQSITTEQTAQQRGSR